MKTIPVSMSFTIELSMLNRLFICSAPDCCFVEDTCVVVKDTAVLNRLGHTSRQKEIQGVEQALQKVSYLIPPLP